MQKTVKDDKKTVNYCGYSLCNQKILVLSHVSKYIYCLSLRKYFESTNLSPETIVAVSNDT